MTEILESLELLYRTSLVEGDDAYHVRIPAELVEDGGLDPDAQYRVALLATDESTDTDTTDASGSAAQSRSVQSAATSTESGSRQATGGGSTSSGSQGRRDPPEPPVSEGETRTVTIDTLGDKGDGIARVERGFIIIVPETKPGDEVEIRITDVKDTVAFAETVSEPTVR